MYLEKLYVIIFTYRIHFCKVSVKSRKFIFGSSDRATFPTMNTTGYGMSGEKDFRKETEQPEDALFFADVYPEKGYLWGEKKNQ